MSDNQANVKNIYIDLQRMVETEDLRQNVNQAMKEHKPLLKLYEDIKYVVQFIHYVLKEYSKKFNVKINENVINWQTEIISLNMLEPYIQDKQPIQDLRRRLKGLITDSFAEGDYEPINDFQDLVNYLQQLVEDISA